MRKELYNLLCRELGAITEIKHIDLWNRNVEFIEQEEGWERPAVFVEFGSIQWKPIVNGVEYRAEPQITLHIVTDWAGAASKPSSRYTYGYRKASVLISLFNALLLVCAVCVIVFESVSKLMEPAPVNGAAVSWTAAAGILVSGISALLMMRFQKKDINTRGAFLHMATDSLLSLGVVISGIVISLSGLYVIDPIVSLVIAAVILYNSVRLLEESVRMIIDGVPRGVDYDAVKSLVAGCVGVKAVEELHVWAVSINQTALTARVAVDGDAGAVRRTLHEELEKLGFSPVTIETI